MSDNGLSKDGANVKISSDAIPESRYTLHKDKFIVVTVQGKSIEVF